MYLMKLELDVDLVLDFIVENRAQICDKAFQKTSSGAALFELDLLQKQDGNPYNGPSATNS